MENFKKETSLTPEELKEVNEPLNAKTEKIDEDTLEDVSGGMINNRVDPFRRPY
jgi:hypothetical protein